jgi:hypothetical protein
MKIEEMKNKKSRSVKLGDASFRHFSLEKAQAISSQALIFLAQDLARVERFLALTGIQPTELRKLAVERGFQLATLDHLASDEALLLQFAKEEGLDPADIAAARCALERQG